MNAQPGTRPDITIADMMLMPGEDAYRVELVRGQLVREPRPATLHGHVLGTLTYLIQAHVADTNAGLVLVDTGFIIDRNPDTVLGPDLAFISAARLPADPYAGAFLVGAPDLAIEIVSPSNTTSELRRKTRDYLRTGARLVWLVDPAARSITVHHASGEATIHGADMTINASPVLPGLHIALSRIFPRR